jgi:hypothetical protein
MFDSGRDDSEQDLEGIEAHAYERVREWTRTRFGLANDSAILVAELRCSIQGCPPLETALAFWTADDARCQFKVLKPVDEIVPSDIAWLIGDLKEQATNYWDCC